MTHYNCIRLYININYKNLFLSLFEWEILPRSAWKQFEPWQRPRESTVPLVPAEFLKNEEGDHVLIVTHAYDLHGHACASHSRHPLQLWHSSGLVMAESPISSAAVDGLWKFILPLQGPSKVQKCKQNRQFQVSRRCITPCNTLFSLYSFPFVFICCVISGLRPGYYAKNAPVAYHDRWPYTEHGGPCGRWPGPECTSAGHPEIRGIGTGCDLWRKTQTTAHMPKHPSSSLSSLLKSGVHWVDCRNWRHLFVESSQCSLLLLTIDHPFNLQPAE